MKPIALALTLLAWPVVSHAQVGIQLADFRSATDGWRFKLLFRNLAGYDDPAVQILSVFSVSMSQRLDPLCTNAVAAGCQLQVTMTTPEGPVQRAPFVAGGTPWQPGSTYDQIGCQSNICLHATMVADFGFGIGVMGCNTPQLLGPAPHAFVARTCDAEGFTGWLAADVRFRGIAKDFTDIPVTLSDFNVNFNVAPLVSVPEPSTWLLFGAGLSVTGVMKRRRPRSDRLMRKRQQQNS